MTYEKSKKFDDLKKIKITNFRKEKHWFEKLVEILFLGQGEWTGYYNKIGAKQRVIAALVQTIWSASILVLFIYILKDQSEKINIVNACGLMAAIFGAAFFREMKDIHNKWDYLAKTFNDIIKLNANDDRLKYSQRDHLAACLAHDILTMNMWAHRSFRSFFKEILLKAVIGRHRSNPSEITRLMEEIAQNGITFESAESLVEDYLESVRAETDRPHLKLVA